MLLLLIEEELILVLVDETLITFKLHALLEDKVEVALKLLGLVPRFTAVAFLVAVLAVRGVLPISVGATPVWLAVDWPLIGCWLGVICCCIVSSMSSKASSWLSLITSAD